MTFQADLPPDAWQRRHEPEMHDVLVMAHWDLVRMVAGKMRQKMPEHVEEDDLRQYGVLGLMRAIRHYDPDSGNAFSKYAVNSIRGVILDELRSLDWAPRSLRKRQRDLNAAERDLRASLGREPSEVELSEHLRWTTTDVQATRRQVDNALPKSLDEMRGAYERTLYDTVSSDEADPETEALRQRERHARDSDTISDRIGEFIESLPEHEKAALVFAFYLGLSPQEVQEALGVDKSTVQRLHEEALEKVRVRMAELLAEMS